MKVLLVDDDADQLFVRRLLLEGIGLQVLTAATVEAGVALARLHKPACAVVDLRLPTEADGVQLLRQLKALDPDIRLILLTGASEVHWRDLLSAGLVSDVIVKGTPISVLLDKLQAMAANQG